MPVSIVAEKYGVLQFSPEIPEHLQSYVVKGAHCQVAQGTFGYMLMQQMEAQHFQVQFNRYCFSSNEQLNLLGRDPMLVLLFNLEAPVVYHMEGVGNLSFLKSSYNIIYLPVINKDIFCEKGLTYQTFFVQLSYDYLASIASHFQPVDELLHKINRREPCVLYPHCPGMPIGVFNIIQEITKSKYSGEVLQIYLMAKITELLFLCFEHEAMPVTASTIHLWKADLESIEATRKDMLENPHQAFNLPALALKAGMNKDKLAKGFRMVVGIPIFDFLIQARMSKAKMLLLTTEFSVSAVGYEVGYQDIHSFSKAFKKFYGLSPGQYRKKFDKGPLN